MSRPSGNDLEELRRAQHKRRMAFMPFLYFRLKPELSGWARAWQNDVHARLATLEAVELAPDCFVAEEAALFAEPTRKVVIGPEASVAAYAFVHGPVTLAAEVSINPYATLDGGRGGIVIGRGSRVATRAALFAFDHGMAADRAVRAQPVRSQGIIVGEDVWICANATITDGVRIGDHAVVGAGAVVTHDVAAWTVVGGVPARTLFDRRDR